MRGAKVDEDRPDFLVIDDIDDPHDSPGVVAKKLRILGRSLLPAGTSTLAVLAIQNLVHPDGVFARLVDNTAEILGDRILSGPVPALIGDFADRAVAVDDHDEPTARPYRIIGSPRPTWAGQNVEPANNSSRIGPTNFRVECQHDTSLAIQGMFADVLPHIVHCTRDEVPDLVRKAIAVDPAVTDTDHSDSHGCQCDGIDTKGTIYRLRSWEQRAAPGHALELAIEWAYLEDVTRVHIEMAGADMSGRCVEQSWESAFNNAVRNVLDRTPNGSSLPRPDPTGSAPPAPKDPKPTARQHAHRLRTPRPHRPRPRRPPHPRSRARRAFEVKPFDLVDAAFWSWSLLRERSKVRGISAAQLEHVGLPPFFRTRRSYPDGY